jgi:putative DNA primase/helicase
VNKHDTTLAANPAEVRQFLEAFTTLARAATEGMANPGLLQIGYVHPLDENGYVATRYMLDDVERMIEDSTAYSNAGNNVYIEGRTVRAGLGRERGTAEDTVAVFALVADDDGDKGKAAKALPISATLLVESSPGNTHPWIFLKKAVTADEGVAFGKALKAMLGGDRSTGTITQPYRISGTVNYPTPSKIKRGRVAVPTKLLSMAQPYSIEEFNAVFPLPPPDCQSCELSDDPVDRLMAEEALSVLNDSNIGREKWVAIGCGLYKNFGEKIGREIFENWSRPSPNYKPRTFRKQWCSFVKGDGYGWTIASLLYYADEADPRWRRRYEERWWREVGDEIEQRLYHSPVDPEWERKLIATFAEPTDEVEQTEDTVEQPLDKGQPPPIETKPAEQRPPKWTPPRRNGVVLVCAKDIIIRPTQWLWEGHLLRGAQELLSGLPGLGKSQVQISLVACVTNGLPWPDGTAAMSPANVIMLTAEDTLDQEVVPRLIAARANLERVQFLKYIRSDGKDRQFLLAEDLITLEGEVAMVGEVALITIDPITACMGGTIDSHKTTEVRSQLGPLKDFAERNNVAVSTITHPAKSTSQKAIDQFIGSQAFVAQARIGHVCIKEFADGTDGEEDKATGRILYTNAKHNASIEMPTLAFRVVGKTIDQDADHEPITAPCITWEGSVNITADEALQAARASEGGGKKNNVQKEAQAFLKEILTGAEPVAAKDVYSKGEQLGFSEDQIKRAKAKLRGVVSVQTSDRIWTWHLPM